MLPIQIWGCELCFDSAILHPHLLPPQQCGKPCVWKQSSSLCLPSSRNHVRKHLGLSFRNETECLMKGLDVALVESNIWVHKGPRPHGRWTSSFHHTVWTLSSSCSESWLSTSGIIKTPHACLPTRNSQLSLNLQPWLVWLGGLSAGLRTKKCPGPGNSSIFV